MFVLQLTVFGNSPNVKAVSWNHSKLKLLGLRTQQCGYVSTECVRPMKWKRQAYRIEADTIEAKSKIYCTK